MLVLCLCHWGQITHRLPEGGGLVKCGASLDDGPGHKKRVRATKARALACNTFFITGKKPMRLLVARTRFFVAGSQCWVNYAGVTVLNKA